MDRTPYAIMPDRWDSYLLWNMAIAEAFFSGQASGRPVYLDIEPKTLEHLASKIDSGIKDVESTFVKALTATLELPPQRGRSVFSLHASRVAEWERKGDSFIRKILNVSREFRFENIDRVRIDTLFG